MSETNIHIMYVFFTLGVMAGFVLGAHIGAIRARRVVAPPVEPGYLGKSGEAVSASGGYSAGGVGVQFTPDLSTWAGWRDRPISDFERDSIIDEMRRAADRWLFRSLPADKV